MSRRIKIVAHVYDSYGNNHQTSRIQITHNSQIVPVRNLLSYEIDNSFVPVNTTLCDIRVVECFDGYVDKPELINLVISGAGSLQDDIQQRINYKVNIISKYIRGIRYQDCAILILSGQSSDSIKASDVFRPLICTQNNAYYTPLPLSRYIDFLTKEYHKYCQNRRIDHKDSVLRTIIKVLALDNCNIHSTDFSFENFLTTIDSLCNQRIISEEYATEFRRIIRNNQTTFENVVSFLSHYYVILKDILYPIIGGDSGYNTSVLNSGLALQVKLCPLFPMSVSDVDNFEYNSAISKLLKEDFKQNFNSAVPNIKSVIVILDNLSFEQAEIFSWIWNDKSSWLSHQENLFIMCLQEDYIKQMKRCTDFDAKINKWYYLNHSDGADLEALFGEKLVYNTSTTQHTEYGGLISINRILKIPTGQGTHTVPTYRPKYSRDFFQRLMPGEGLLKVRGQEIEHQFKCLF